MAERVRSDGRDEVAFVGVPDGLEARLASEAGVEFIGVPAKGWDRAAPATLVAAAFTMAGSFFRCLWLLRKRRTDVVIGFGGFVSLPLGLAAALGGIPLVIHEQNSVPGLANRVLSRWAKVACVTYAGSLARLAHPTRALVTGNPVRPAIMEADGTRGRHGLRIRKNETVLLVFGGSRGARHINQAVLALYPRLKEVPKLQVVQIAGRAEAAAVREQLAKEAGGTPPLWWNVLDYVDDMGDVIAAADLVVCRAGATTLAELGAIGRASVLVPYPFATDDHQTSNTVPFAEAGAASVVDDSGLDAAGFGDEVMRLLSDAASRRAMAEAAGSLGRPYAAEEVAEAALAAAASGSPWRTSARRGAAIGPAEPDRDGGEDDAAPAATAPDDDENEEGAAS